MSKYYIGEEVQIRKALIRIEAGQEVEIIEKLENGKYLVQAVFEFEVKESDILEPQTT